MPYCARLIYASTTTSSPSTIRQDLSDILEKARIHNVNHQIHGVLFYGNNYFLQCIEGRKTQIDELYAKIAMDKRHKNITVLAYEEIHAPSFINWDMKYVVQEKGVQQFFIKNRRGRFNPYRLQGELVDQFLRFLIEQQDSVVGRHEIVIERKSSIKKYMTACRSIAVVMIIGLLVMLAVYYFFAGADESSVMIKLFK